MTEIKFREGVDTFGHGKLKIYCLSESALETGAEGHKPSDHKNDRDDSPLSDIHGQDEPIQSFENGANPVRDIADDGA